MTLAASNATMKQDLQDLRFDFSSAELTSHLRQSSKDSPTGYWTIRFERTEDHEAVTWYVSLLEGKIIHSGLEVPSANEFIEIMQRFSGLRKGAIGQHLKVLRSNPGEKQGTQVKQMIRHLVVAGLVNIEEIEKAFKIYLLNDFDRYLLHTGGGNAFYTPVPAFSEFVPIKGFELNTILLESIRRRVEWTSFRPQIPSLESILTLPSKSANGISLQETQWQTLKGLIQDGKTITEIAQSMGKDSLVVAKSFTNLIQQKLIVIPSTNEDEPTEVVKTANQIPEVFIVDDSPLLIRQFRSLLEHWGYIVHACEDSESATEKILKIQPAIIFLDINMPVVTGFDLIKQIRRQASLNTVPLVMLTAEKSVSNQWRAQWASCKFLAKPRSPDDVSEFRVELKDLLRTLAPLASDVLV